MIVFPLLGSLGRLGNQMFQLAATIALAEHTKTKAKLPKDLFNRMHHGQKCLLHNFKIDLEEYDENDSKIFFKSYVQPTDNNLKYYREFWDLPPQTKLEGFFESELYFFPYKENVLKHLQLKEEIEQEAKDYLQKKKVEGKEIVGIHLRLGDYKFVWEHIGWYYNYIELVKSQFFAEKEKYIFLFFTGGCTDPGNSNKSDIAFCKQHLPNAIDYIFCELNDTIKEFAVMKNCDHLVLTTRSTLGWWAGYLNDNQNRKVICPRQIPGVEFNPDTLWPKKFIQVK